MSNDFLHHSYSSNVACRACGTDSEVGCIGGYNQMRDSECSQKCSVDERRLLLELLDASRDYMVSMKYQIDHRLKDAIEACDEISTKVKS